MDDLRELFFRSFEQFAEREAENILDGTSERNLCARWAPLLEKAAVEAGYGEYRADTEYNRKQSGQVKTILDETMHVVRITCDLILHSRGRVPERDNLIAIEMKRLSHPEREKQKDRVRLRALTKASYDTSGRRTDGRCPNMCAAMGSVISWNSMQMGGDSDLRNISAATFQPKRTGPSSSPAHVASASN